MPRALIVFLLTTSAVLGAALVVVSDTLPPRAAALAPALPPTIALGGYHVHSNRSDGSGSVDAIAAAAHDAGLSFVILTDHGDGTVAPLPPMYRSGVLCIDAVEVSTNGGHVVALGMTGASPYPMAGEPGDVIDDIHRRQGFAIVAHPDSPKAELQWRAWNVPYDGIEWLNADSEWRSDQSAPHVAMVVGRMLWRAPETIVSLFTRPTPTLRRWDGVTRRRPVVALAGLDAHANLAGWPRYVDMFRALADAVVLDAPLTGRPDDDARTIIAAIRHGHTYALVRGIASPAALTFTATDGSATASMGDVIDASGTVTWHASVPQTTSARVALIADGREVATGRGQVTYRGPAQAGAVHVEVTYPGFTVPWIVSNPIYVGIAPSPAPDGELPPPRGILSTDPVDLLAAPNWRVEHDAVSTGAIANSGEWSFSYALSGGMPAGQYAAAVVPVDLNAGTDRVQLVARADRPMRLSVQIKLAGPGGGQRWRRSVYLDTEPRTLVLPLSSFIAADRPTSQQPIFSVIREVLLVVDTVNTAPGSRGTIWLSSAALGRVKP
jgi:hypothetical protein